MEIMEVGVSHSRRDTLIEFEYYKEVLQFPRIPIHFFLSPQSHSIYSTILYVSSTWLLNNFGEI